MRIRTLTAWTALLLLASTGCSNGSDAAKTYAGVEEVFAAAREAFGKQDYPAWVDCYTAEIQAAQVNMVLGLFAAAIDNETATVDKQAKQEYLDLLANHGVTDRGKKSGETDEQQVARLATQVKDKRAFLIDHLKWYKSKKSRTDLEAGTLVDLKTTGETAQADYSVKSSDGSTMSQQVHFRRVGGSWRIDTIVGW